MKRALFIAFISIVFSSCAPRQHAAGDGKTPATMVEVNLKIEGMTCDDCEASIKKGVTELTGIDSISSNYEDSTAFVRFDSTKTNLKEISEAIAKRGYEVK